MFSLFGTCRFCPMIQWLIGSENMVAVPKKGGNFPTSDPVSTGKASSSKRLTVDAPQKIIAKLWLKGLGLVTLQHDLQLDFMILPTFR